MSEFDTTKMTVGEIRDMLVNDYGCSREKVDEVKGKSLLVELLQDAVDETLEVDDIDFGNNEESGDFEEVEEENEVCDIPLRTDIEWHDYVMSNFAPDELMDGNPTVDGMRRLVNKLVGEITSIQTNVIQTPEQVTPKGYQNDRRATVVVSVYVDEKRYDGAGDVYWGNTDKIFRNYPISVAETRAEGRALKRVLGLRKVNAAEELAGKIEHDISAATVTAENVEEGMITPTQLQFLSVMCGSDRLDVNIKKLIESLGMPTQDVKGLSHAQALAINEKLSLYQTQKEEVPEVLKGYDSEWQN